MLGYIAYISIIVIENARRKRRDSIYSKKILEYNRSTTGVSLE
jgi:hypothetical protein